MLRIRRFISHHSSKCIFKSNGCIAKWRWVISEKMKFKFFRKIEGHFFWNGPISYGYTLWHYSVLCTEEENFFFFCSLLLLPFLGYIRINGKAKTVTALPEIVLKLEESWYRKRRSSKLKYIENSFHALSIKHAPYISYLGIGYPSYVRFIILHSTVPIGCHASKYFTVIPKHILLR